MHLYSQRLSDRAGGSDAADQNALAHRVPLRVYSLLDPIRPIYVPAASGFVTAVVLLHVTRDGDQINETYSVMNCLRAA